MDEYDQKRIKDSIDNEDEGMLDKIDFRLIRNFAKFATATSEDIKQEIETNNPQIAIDREQDTWERENLKKIRERYQMARMKS